MMSGSSLLRSVLTCAALLVSLPLHAAEEFPFGLEMTLDTSPQRGSKRVPNLEIGDSGETRVELWCKGGKGQFSVAGDTVMFMPGAMEPRNCPEALSALDDQLLADLGSITNWQRRDDVITFTGPKTLRFRLNTN